MNVIFDMDGLMFDTESVFVKAWDYAGEQMGIVCGDMIAQSKSNPEIYLRACALLGAVPGDTYALEDSKNGLLSAYKAGCKPIMIPDLW